MKLNKEIHELFREAQAIAGMHNVEVAGYLTMSHCILSLRDALERLKEDEHGSNKKALVQGEE